MHVDRLPSQVLTPAEDDAGARYTSIGSDTNKAQVAPGAQSASAIALPLILAQGERIDMPASVTVGRPKKKAFHTWRMYECMCMCVWGGLCAMFGGMLSMR